MLRDVPVMSDTISVAQAAGGSALSSILSLSTDIFVIVGIFTALLLWGVWKGQSGLATLILSLIVATTLYKAFPFGAVFAVSPFVPIAIFIALAGASYFILTGLVSVFSFEGGVVSWIKTILLAILATTLLVAITHHVISIDPIYTWSGAVEFLFEPAQYFFWWLLAPLVILFFI